MEPEPSIDEASSTVHTYHCICHNLILATYQPLESFPSRASSKDGSRILSASAHSQVVHTVEDGKAMIIRRDDGFEKRKLVRCERCRLVIAYKLDGDHFEDSNREVGEQTLYVLPGALVVTAGMMAGKAPEIPAWAVETA